MTRQRVPTSHCRGRHLAPDLSITDPTPGGATAHGESEDHHGRGDDCDRDPEDGSTKNSLHDGRPCFPELAIQPDHRFTPHTGVSEIGSRTGLPVCMGRHADHRNRGGSSRLPGETGGHGRPSFRCTEPVAPIIRQFGTATASSPRGHAVGSPSRLQVCGQVETLVVVDVRRGERRLESASIAATHSWTWLTVGVWPAPSTRG